jgi:putative transposase
MLAVVLLPDHIHCIWKLPEQDSDFSLRWSIIKRNFSKMWLSSAGRVGRAHHSSKVAKSRRQHREVGIWQRRFWEHAIRDEEDFAKHVNYIHFNPVKHGYVKCPHQWPYSSFSTWVDQDYLKLDWRCRCNSAAPSIIDFKDIEGCVGE